MYVMSLSEATGQISWNVKYDLLRCCIFLLNDFLTSFSCIILLPSRRSEIVCMNFFFFFNKCSMRLGYVSNILMKIGQLFC